MANSESRVEAKAVPRVSLDTWAVFIALLAAALIRFGVLPRIPW